MGWNIFRGKPSPASSTASHPGGLTLSYKKLRLIEPWMFGFRLVLRKIVLGFLWIDFELVTAKDLEEHLAGGDCRAAVVVSSAPLLVAVYSDEMDCVAVLRFRRAFADAHQLEVGSRLLTVNTYQRPFFAQSDLAFGPGHTGRWTGFFPVIAEFLSDDDDRIERRKRQIDEAEWRRCRELGDAYLFERPGLARNGRPRWSHERAGAVKESVIAYTVASLVVAVVCVIAWHLF